MTVSIEKILTQNITVVYESLDYRSIDSNILKNMIENTQSVVMDTPENIVAIYPSKQVVIMIGDRRIKITNQAQSDEIAEIPLWDYVRRCHDSLSNAKVVAYGFNYDVGVSLGEINANEMVLNSFLENRGEMEDIFEGGIENFIPRYKFRRDGTLNDLFFEVLGENKVKVHLNTHFEQDELPPKDVIAEQYRTQFAYFQSLVPKLFTRI